MPMVSTDALRRAALRSLELRGIRQVVRPFAGYETSMLVAGSGGTSLVWLPALGDGASSFGTAMSQLSAELPDLTVIAVDPPGYGYSTPEGDVDLPSFAGLGQWLQELAEALPGPIVAAGNSSGAQLAAELALAAGDRTRRLVFVAWTDFRFAAPPSMDVLCPADDDALDELWTRAWHAPPMLPPSVRAEMIQRLRHPQLRRHAASWRPESFAAALSRCASPRAFVGGLSDGLVPPAAIERSAAEHAAEVRWIESAGHFPHREQPRRFVDAFRQMVSAHV
jgi:pimeloyl-ACP methyl ester carboxylesterase